MEKKKVGRPRKLVKEKQQRMCYVSDQTYEFYFMLGHGNFSKGLEVVKKLMIDTGIMIDKSR